MLLRARMLPGLTVRAAAADPATLASFRWQWQPCS
jgi:hypothetical protein